MQSKTPVLFTVALLLAMTLAEPRQDTRSVRMPSSKGAVLPAGVDANDVIRQVRRGQRLEPQPAPEAFTLPDTEFMPAPNFFPSDKPGNEDEPSVAFDGTNYFLVWRDHNDYFWEDYDVIGARVSATGALLDSGGIDLTTNMPNPQGEPSVAFDGTNYLVVWNNSLLMNGHNQEVVGARVSPSGVLIDPIPFVVAQENESQWWPHVAFDGTNYLVVWLDTRNEYLAPDVYGARVTPAAEVLDPHGIAISVVWGSAQSVPCLAFNGTHYLVVWDDTRDGYDNVYGARVSTAGVVLDPDGIRITTMSCNWDGDFRVASDGTNYLVAWSSASDSRVYGARVSTEGVVLDPSGIPISAAGRDQLVPSLAFDGANYLVVCYDRSNANYLAIWKYLVDPAGRVIQEHVISTRPNYPSDYVRGLAIACGPGTALVAYRARTGVFGGKDYRGWYRIWARLVPPPGDVGSDSIICPVASYLMPGWPLPPRVVIKNYGDDDQGTFNVKLTVSPGSYSSTKTVWGLGAGEARTIQFDSIELETGSFTAKCSTMLPNDTTRGNDALTSLFQGCTFIDFFDLTDGGLTADPSSGNWSHGVPQSPWTWPPMDSTVWGDRLSGYYGSNENSMLTSPTYVALQDSPAVAFQHAFNTEVRRDGGNFSYWTSGSHWTRLSPCAGLEYNTRVFALGDSGWSDRSYGWNQSVFTIPVAENTQFQVRWRFASDESNNDCNGWLLDEVAGIGCDTAPGGDRPPQDENSIIAALDFSPNPVHGSGCVSYTLLRDCQVSVRLYDAAGRLVTRPATNGFKKGVNTAALDATGLGRGIYFLTLAGAGDSKTTKVVIE